MTLDNVLPSDSLATHETEMWECPLWGLWDLSCCPPMEDWGPGEESTVKCFESWLWVPLQYSFLKNVVDIDTCVSSEFYVPSLSQKSIWDGYRSPLCLLVILAPCFTHSITAATWNLSGPFSSAFCPAVFRAFVVQILPKSLIKVFLPFQFCQAPDF